MACLHMVHGPAHIFCRALCCTCHGTISIISKLLCVYYVHGFSPDWSETQTLSTNYQKNKLVLDPNKGFGRNSNMVGFTSMCLHHRLLTSWARHDQYHAASLVYKGSTIVSCITLMKLAGKQTSCTD